MDSRDLIEEREDLKEQILEDFKDTFEDYADDTEEYEDIRMEEEEIESWKEMWQDEIDTIEAIDNLERDVSSREWEHGIHFIEEDDFEDYCKDLIQDIGALPSNLPSYIEDNINWEGVADDLRVDYIDVDYDGITYLFRD